MSKEKSPPVPNGVLVIAEEVDGDTQISVEPTGKTKQTELPVLLGLARKLAERQLGVEGR